MSNNNRSHVLDAFDAWIQQTFKLTEEEVRRAWEELCAEHLPPSRIAELGLGLADVAEREAFHLRRCERCRSHIQAYETSVSDGPVDRHSVVALEDEVDDVLHRKSCEELRGVDSPRSTLRLSEGSVPAVVRAAFQTDEPILFPGGEVARRSWQFGWMSGLNREHSTIVEEATSVCCTRLFEKLKCDLPADSNNLVLVCFGEAMHRCGIRVGARLLEELDVCPRLVLAHDYYKPRLVGDREEFRESRVVVLVDVVRTGTLLRRLIGLCRELGAADVAGLALIDQTNESLARSGGYALWVAPREPRETFEEFCQSASDGERRRLRVFDPNSSCAVRTFYLSQVHGESDKSPSQPVIMEAELEECISRTGAMRRDFDIEGIQYPFAVNVSALIRKHSDSRECVLQRSQSVLAEYKASPTILVYHTGRSRRAGLIAESIGSVTDWPTCPIGTAKSTFKLTTDQCRRLAAFDNVIIVDAAIRTGDSMTALVRSVKTELNESTPRVVGFTVLNSLTDSQVEGLEQNLEFSFRYAYRLPLAPPSTNIRHWATLHKKTICKDLIEHCPSQSIQALMTEYCTPGHRETRRRARCTREQAKRESDDSTTETRLTAEAIEDRRILTRVELSEFRFLSAGEVVNDPTMQAMLKEVLYSSAAPQFKESAAIALAATGQCDWLTGHWLAVNESFLVSRGSAWKALVMTEQQMAKNGYQRELKDFRDAAVSYRKCLEAKAATQATSDTQRKLLLGGRHRDILTKRLSVLIEAADSFLQT